MPTDTSKNNYTSFVFIINKDPKHIFHKDLDKDTDKYTTLYVAKHQKTKAKTLPNIKRHQF